MNPLNAYLAQAVMADRYRHADDYRRARPERAQERRHEYESVTIRRATPDDWSELQRLAQLESRHVPAGAAILAEVDERVLAAIWPHDGTTMADPFRCTAALVGLLETRAAQLTGRRSAVARPLRRAAARVSAFARH